MGSKSRSFGRKSADDTESSVHYSVLGFHVSVADADKPEVTYTLDLEMAEAFFDDDRDNDEIGAGSWYETRSKVLETVELRILMVEKFGALDSQWVPPLTGTAKFIVSRYED